MKKRMNLLKNWEQKKFMIKKRKMNKKLKMMKWHNKNKRKNHIMENILMILTEKYWCLKMLKLINYLMLIKK